MWRSVSIMQKCQSLSFRWLNQLLLFLLLPVLYSSCTVMQPLTSPKKEVRPQAFAEQLFLNGDFENATLEYEQIYETALSAEDKNHALYGLACTQLMLARNEDQLVEAINNLQQWDANKGNAPFVENRHLLILALQQQGELIKKRKNNLRERQNEQNALIANQQIKIAKMTATIEDQQNQIEKLQTQISELEAIDKNVQEKRKPL
jgi:hypothetical protein